MGRHSSKPLRQSLLGSLFEGANTRVLNWTHQTVACMVKADFTKEELIRWLFDDDTRCRLQSAYPLSEKHTLHQQYEVPGCGQANVWISFEDVEMLVPRRDVVNVDAIAAQPLFDVCAAIAKIREDFAIVHYVLEWMDTNATMGAMRYYWPSVGALAPDFELGNCPVSFRDPKGIENMPHLLRHAARVVAEAQLIPKQTIPSRGISLPFTGHTIEPFGQIFYAPARDFYI